MVLVPQRTMNRLWTICSGSMPVPGSDRRRQPGRRDGAADVAIEVAAAHRSEQATVERMQLDQPLHAGGTVGQDGLRAGLRDDPLPARGDVGERFVPAHPCELSPCPWGPRV